MYKHVAKYLILTVSFALLIGCENKDEVDEFDSERFIPESKRDYNFDDEKDSTSLLSGELSVESFREVVELVTEGSEWREVEKSVYLYRFGANHTISLETISDMDTSYWYITSYTDSIFSQNALYNWLDCFGENCTSVKIKDELIFKKTSGQVWWTDTLIIYYESKGKNISGKHRESISTFFEDNLRIHFYWNKNQKFKWVISESQREV